MNCYFHISTVFRMRRETLRVFLQLGRSPDLGGISERFCGTSGAVTHVIEMKKALMAITNDACQRLHRLEQLGRFALGEGCRGAQQYKRKRCRS
jgi:hypothetical protein